MKSKCIIECQLASPIEYLVILEWCGHIHAHMHIATDKIQIMEFSAHLYETESRWTHTNRRWIASGQSILVQHRIVHNHFEFECKVVRMIGDIHAADRSPGGYKHAGTAATHTVMTFAWHTIDQHVPLVPGAGGQTELLCKCIAILWFKTNFFV